MQQTNVSANVKHLPTSSHTYIQDPIWNKQFIALLKVSKQLKSIRQQ